MMRDSWLIDHHLAVREGNRHGRLRRTLRRLDSFGGQTADRISTPIVPGRGGHGTVRRWRPNRSNDALATDSRPFISPLSRLVLDRQSLRKRYTVPLRIPITTSRSQSHEIPEQERIEPAGLSGANLGDR